MTDTPTPSEQKPLKEKSEAELKREAKARLRLLSPATIKAIVREVLHNRVGGSMSGFVTFLRERAIVGLAVGFAIGSQAQVVVKQFISSFVDPLFKLLIPGDQVLSARNWTIGFGGHTAIFGWGAMVYTLIDFLFILFMIYLVIHLLRLDQLDKKQ
ncbi:MAG TPA: MscL family protein [Verrucomicrobiae bacterium]|nr:MscL family protein [Verrucomicrobiae bacterium]